MRGALRDMFLHVCKMLGLFWLARHVSGRGLRILGYHGFDIAGEDPYRLSLFMSEAKFVDRLAYIRRAGFSVLPLPEALDRLAEGTLPRDALCITIDDGFYASYIVGIKALRSFRFPATIYVTTYYVVKENPIFRLAIRYMFARTQARPFEIKGREWADDQVVDLLDARASERVMWEIVTYGEQYCDEPQREQISREVGQLLGVDYQRIKEKRLVSLMNQYEIKELAGEGFDIGLHTHRHSFPQDNEYAAKEEVRQNREILERIVGRPVEHFCYPSGLWAKHQWSWLEDLKVRTATTCEPGVNREDTPRFALHRFMDAERTSRITFEAELSGFLDLMRRARRLLRRSSHEGL
jgi:peptidoglycan/xylan/chitin deacetylase (PgdA/CDA1 family)